MENKKQKLMHIVGKRMLVSDSREPGESTLYSFLVDEDAPRHLKRQLGKKSMFEFVYFCDEAEGMDGLVD
jgi:hypothetical protein